MYNNTPELFFDSSLLADSETTIEYKITHRIITYEMDNPTPRLEVCPHCGHIGLHITWFTKTIKNRWDGIVGMAKYGINSAILEGVNGYIKNMRRSSFGFSDFDFFGLLIWEHTHMKAKRKTEEASHVKKRYKPRSKPNSKKASKQTIYIKERDSNGKIISA